METPMLRIFHQYEIAALQHGPSWQIAC